MNSLIHMDTPQRVWIIIDNIDQRDRKNQLLILQTARLLVTRLHVETILTIRPHTKVRNSEFFWEYIRENVNEFEIPSYSFNKIILNRAFCKSICD